MLMIFEVLKLKIGKTLGFLKVDFKINP